MKNIPFALLEVNNETYKLKISASSAIEAEKKLGCSLTRAWAKLDSVNVQITILWAALQRYHHGISFEQTMELYDQFVDEGKGQDELVDLFMEVYKCSGFMKREALQQEEKAENPNKQ